MTSSSNAVWCHNDLRSIASTPIGQLNEYTQAGRFLIELVRKEPLGHILDIGTWNGLGSTKCFLLGLQGHSYSSFTSLECNRDKHTLALKNLAPLLTNRDRLLWGSILTSDEAPLERVCELFPEVRTDREFQRWHTIDMSNVSLSPYVLDQIPAELDFVLFDGGEFTTWFEFEKLLPRCSKYIALDDCDVAKCKAIRERLQRDSNWVEIAYIKDRNGFSAFRRRSAAT